MLSKSDPHQDPSEPRSANPPHQPDPVGTQRLELSDALHLVEPVWTILAVLLVYVSYLTGAGSALPWIGLALVCLPLPVRLIRKQPLIRRTPFDIPMALLMLGAIVGLCVSPERTMSLGAFQCMLATTISYYIVTSHTRPDVMMKGLILVLPVIFVILLILLIVNVIHGLPQREAAAGNDTSHGIALQLSLAAAVFLGIAVFSKQVKIRIPAAAVFVAFFVVVVVITSQSLRSLVQGVSVEGRMPLWRDTASLLGDSPVFGLGLGCWAQKYYGTMDLWSVPNFDEVTHPHNAYLELYCNTGLLGVLALIVALIIGARLSLAIIRSPRNHPWYGFGFGIVLASVVALLVGIVESAPVGAPHLAAGTYYYAVCPTPWALCCVLVIAHRLITRGTTG